MIIYSKTSKNINKQYESFKAPSANLKRIYLLHNDLLDTGIYKKDATYTGENLSFINNACYLYGARINIPIDSQLLLNKDKTYVLWANISYQENNQTLLYAGYPTINSYLHIYFNKEYVYINAGSKIFNIKYEYYGINTLIQILYTQKKIIFNINTESYTFTLENELNLSTSYMFLGNIQDMSQPLFGSINNVRLYSRVLTVTEQKHMLNEIPTKLKYLINNDHKLAEYLFENNELINTGNNQNINIDITSGFTCENNSLICNNSDYAIISNIPSNTPLNISFDTENINSNGLLLSTNFIQISGANYNYFYKTDNEFKQITPNSFFNFNSYDSTNDITFILKIFNNVAEIYCNNFKCESILSSNMLDSILIGGSKRYFKNIRIYDSILDNDSTLAIYNEKNYGYNYPLKKEGFDIWGFLEESLNFKGESKYPQNAAPENLRSYTDGTWRVFASSEYSTSNQAWVAFSGIPPVGDHWHSSGNNPKWIAWQNLKQKILIRRLAITSSYYDDAWTSSLNKVRLEGSNDGENWIPIAELSGSYGNRSTVYHTFANNTPYYYHRIYSLTPSSYMTVGNINAWLN